MQQRLCVIGLIESLAYGRVYLKLYSERPAHDTRTHMLTRHHEVLSRLTLTKQVSAAIPGFSISALDC